MSENESKNFLSSSFTDLMASLAVIFILLTVVFLKNAGDKSKEGKDAIRTSLGAILDKNNLDIEQDKNDPLSLSVRVGEDALKFALNSSSVSAAGVKFLSSFAPSLARELCKGEARSKVDSIVIEGHTDRSGENGPEGLNHNIRLSQDRAFSVLSQALSAIRSEPDLHECFLKLASASGRGSRIPIEIGGEYKADRSRRVEIKIRVKSTEQSYFLKNQ